MGNSLPVAPVKKESIRRLAGENPDHQLIAGDIISVEPVPVELMWNMTDKEFDEYKKTASGLLKFNAGFLEESLRRFLRSNNIPVYPFADVSRMLRYYDGSVKLYSLMEHQESRKFGYSNLGGLNIAGVFQNFIPWRVIRRIHLVLGEFPELYCFISDYKNPLESFVVVVLKENLSIFVIDTWSKNESAIAGKGGV